MNIPIIQGLIDRRILVNFRVAPEVLARVLPAPFEPKLEAGFGVAGVCLIRLKHIRPRLLPLQLGVQSENAAHRIAVQWRENGEHRQGVFIPRRDTSSRLNTLIGGRLFPGEHHRAQFQISEQGGEYRVRMVSDDGLANLLVEGRVANSLPPTSIFETIEHASRFFESGSVGYSARSRPGEFEGLELRTRRWAVEPMDVDRVESSYFSDRGLFPQGSAAFDHALLMRGIAHEWHGLDSMYVEPQPQERQI